MSARLPEIAFDEESHTYRVAGRVVPNVTRILEPLCNWEMVPADILDRKCELGRAVHLATYFHDKGTLDEASLSGEVRGYLEGWRRFRREMNPVLLNRERKVYHPDRGYCGTLDVEMMLDGLAIADIKSGVKSRVHGVQIAAYADARRREEGWAIYPKRLGIYLSADGRYELVPYLNPADYATFVSALNIWNWRNAR